MDWRQMVTDDSGMIAMQQTVPAHESVGAQLREWRQRRRRSQLDLALDADVSARHLSFLETGRSLPSREMLLRLAEHLEIPLRERNTLLVAAGYAPVYHETPLDAPSMTVARRAIDLVLAGHEPNPAIAIDRHWHLVAANRAHEILIEDLPPEMLEPPVNVLRLSLHPDGLAPRIVNIRQWREHALTRLQQQVANTADPFLAALHAELAAYPTPDTGGGDAASFGAYGDIVLPVRIRTRRGVLAFFTTTTIFGTANDITLDELAIESFFPADEATATALLSS
jgi:transcriptional regulator with XRE-family HTH domain